MSTNSTEDHWFWDGKGTPDEKRDRRRVFHKSILLRYGDDGTTRRFNVGDTVNMAGGEETWVAQILDLFQVNAHDPELRQILRTDSLRNESKHHYELKRCTLRWFYNFSDMDETSLRNAKWPKLCDDEIWWSDHIEKPGYNSVQVIHGKAWLFDNMREEKEFLADPPDDYNKDRDITRIVRGFVDSKRDHLPARLLYDDELTWLQSNPSDDKNLFYSSKRRFEQRLHSPSKRKRSKHRRSTSLREPVNVDEDEFDPAEVSPKTRKRKHRAEHALVVQEVTPTRRPVRRRKVTIDDDEESSMQDVGDDQSDNIPLSQLRPSGHGTAEPETVEPNHSEQTISQINVQVLDLVADLNSYAFADDAPETSTKPPEQTENKTSRHYPAVDEDEITPAPPKPEARQKQMAQKGKTKATVAPKVTRHPPKPSPPTKNDDAIIIIDSEEDEPPPKVQPQRSPPKLHRFHPGAANRAYRGGRHGKPSARNRSSFMPTSRERQTPSSKKYVDPQRDESGRRPSGPIVDKAPQSKRVLKSKDSVAVGARTESPSRPRDGKNVHMKDSHNSSTAVRNSAFHDSDEITPNNGSKPSAEGRGTKRVAEDDVAHNQSAAKRRSLSSVSKKPKASESRSEKVQSIGNSADRTKDVVRSEKAQAIGNSAERMKDVVKSTDRNHVNKIREKPGAREVISDNAIEVNDSDTEPDDRRLQEDGPSVLKVTQDQRKLIEDVYRIHGRMSAADKDFLSNKLEWLIDEVVLFRDGQKGSLNEDEYERVLRDQLVQQREREIGSLREVPVFESDSQPKAPESRD